MQIVHATVERYRGIARLSVDFGPTTVLIGENDAGKSTLIRAIAVCLGGGAPAGTMEIEPRDRHGEATGAGPIRIRLHLSASEPREWERLATKALRDLTGPDRDGRPGVVLDVTADMTETDPTRRVRWAIRRPGVVDESGDHQGKAGGETGDRRAVGTDPALLTELRRVCPAIVIPVDRPFLRGEPPASTDEPGARPGDGHAGMRPAPATAHDALLGRARALYRRVAGMTRPVREEDLDRVLASSGAGAMAVLGWLRHAHPTADADADTSASARRIDRPGGALTLTEEGAKAWRPGSGLARLAALLVLGALLEIEGHANGEAPGRRAPDHPGGRDGIRPIVIVEDAEAHLHPRLLAAAASILAELPVQKILTSNSGELLTFLPLESVRRLVRTREGTRVHAVHPDALSVDDRRRIGYHVRVGRAGAFFARCWLLVEGETEFWLLGEIAAAIGFDFALEGIRCLEYAQAGVEPLVRLAEAMGIEWHLLTDGDRMGGEYQDAARDASRRAVGRTRVTRLEEPDIEYCLFEHGYADVYLQAAGFADVASAQGRRGQPLSTRAIIDRAIRSRSKPALALDAIDAMRRRGRADGRHVPAILRRVVEQVVEQAREGGA